MPRVEGLRYLIAAVLVAVGPAPAHALDSGPAGMRVLADTTPQAASDSSGKREFPIAEIPTQSEVTSARLREMDQELQPSREIRAIEAGLSGARDTVTAIWEFQREILEKQQSRRLLLDLNQEWARRETQYIAWRRAVQSRSAALAQLVGEVDSMRGRWTRTLETATKPEVPKQITGQVQATMDGLQAEAARINKRLDALLVAQYSITKLLLDIEQARDEITSMLGAERRELFHMDSPPLWSPAAYAGIPNPALQMRTSLEATVRAVRYFSGVYRGRLIPHVVVTLLLIGLALGSRRRLAAVLGSEPDQARPVVAQHPVSCILLTSLIATWWIYPHALLPVYDLVLLATALPLSVLIPAYLEPRLRRPAMALLALGTLTRLCVILIGDSPALRFVLLPLAVLGCAWILVDLRPAGVLRSSETGASSGLSGTVARLALLGLVIAILANVLGNASLAILLTLGVLASAYLALLLTALVHVLTNLVVLLLGAKTAERSRFVQHHRAKLRSGGSRVVRLLAILTWAGITLQIFTLFEPIQGGALRFLGAKYTLGLATVSVGGILIFLGTIWLSVVIGRSLSSILEHDVLDRMDLPYGLPSTIGKLVRYTLIASGFFLALAAIGVELTKLTILGGALGVGVGFGLQNIVNNFVSGLILAFERPIREGDVIEAGGVLGTVVHIGARASTIRTPDGAEVVVPNADLIAKQVVNWTLSDRNRRIVIPLGVAYGSNPSEVMKLLIATSLEHPKVLRVPEPIVLFKGFGESSLDFELLCWSEEFGEAGIIKGEIAIGIYEALQQAGIEIPFPQRDLHVRSVDEAAAGVFLRGESRISGAGAD